MTDAAIDTDAPVKKSGKGALVMWVVLCLSLAGIGFYGTYSGLFFGNSSGSAADEAEGTLEDLSDISFVPVDPVVVSLKRGSPNKHMSFRAQLEVPTQYKADVEHLLPRITAVMNGYLRALETEDFESPEIIIRLRSQLLRRVQVVVGNDRVNDLLVMEFVLN
mgnify:CR=1 FL=1